MAGAVGLVYLEQFHRRDFDFVREFGGNRDGFHFSVTVVGDADYGEHAGGDENGRGGDAFGREFAEAEKVIEHAGAFFFHEDVDLEEIFEAERLFVIAGGVDAGETEGGIEVIQRDGETEGAIEGVLGGFHVAEKI